MRRKPKAPPPLAPHLDAKLTKVQRELVFYDVYARLTHELGREPRLSEILAVLYEA